MEPPLVTPPKPWGQEPKPPQPLEKLRLFNLYSYHPTFRRLTCPQKASKELAHQSLRPLGLNPATGGTRPAEPAQPHLSLSLQRIESQSEALPRPHCFFSAITPLPQTFGESCTFSEFSECRTPQHTLVAALALRRGPPSPSSPTFSI